MVIKVGINGFGRIGRIVSRACLQHSGLQLSAINDPAITAEYVSYLLKFDSTHGKLSAVITQHENEIIIDGKPIKVFHEKYPPNIPWQAADVHFVIEASGMFTCCEKASGHLVSVGVRRVIVTAPSADVPMLVLGVNDCDIHPGCTVISSASSTLYCLAPIIKVLEDSFGVEEGFVTCIHAMTPSLKPLDGLCLRGRHWRDHRSIHQNIIPAPTGACKALGKILPQTKDKLTGIAFRVPVVNVSVLDLTIKLQNSTKMQEIVHNIHQAQKSTLRNIIKVSNEQAVSSDFVGESHSCIFDESSSIQLKPNYFKLICWYENEYSYACRIIDSIIFSENQYFLDIDQSLIRLNPVTSSKMLQTESPSTIQYTSGEKHTLVPTLIKKSTTILPVAKNQRIKTDQLLKIWNSSRDTVQPCVRPIGSPFFSVGPAPPIKKIENNNQERLETVRREFTKMVSITEDLLRKTQSTQGVRSASIDEIKQLSRINLMRDKDAHSYTIVNSKIKPVNLLDNKYSGNTILTQNDITITDDTVSLASSIIDKSEIDRNSIKTIDSKNLIYLSMRTLKRNNENNDKEVSINIKNEIINEGLDKLGMGECKQISDSIVLNDEIQQNKEFKYVNSCKQNINNEIEKEQPDAAAARKKIVNELQTRYCVYFSKEEKNKNILENNKFEHRKHKITPNICELSAKKSNMNLIDEALRKRNIILVSDTVAENKSESSVKNADHLPSIEDIVHVTKPVLDYFPITTVSEETSKYVTPENTITIEDNGACGETQDIYDKLDSTSGSDNSFDINERKSQVIQLQDLTNSLEDLARLNNICRIIEISDEMSDKLFSALDGEGNNLKKKKWSFKDLCARIKLDEFCNKVFGGTAVSE